MSTSIWQLVIGVVGISAGVLMILNRVTLARLFADKLDAQGSRSSAKSSTPGGVAFAGVAFSLITLVIALNGLTKLL